MPWARWACARRSISLSNRCVGHGCRCAGCRMAASKLRQGAIVCTPCPGGGCLFSIVTSSATPISHCSALETSTHPVPSQTQRDLLWFPCLNTAAAPIRRSSEHDPSAHHILTPACLMASFFLAQRCAALLAVVSSSSLLVFTTDSSPGAGQFMPSVVRPC
jgi:hypothetical protein